MKCVRLQRKGFSQRTPRAWPLTFTPTLRSARAKGGVYVPSDSFGGQSPERKAAGILRTFFTFVAARVVLAQLEGSGRGALGAYDSKAATDLHHFLQNVPMKDGDEWLTQIMRQNSSLGLRLMEVRDNYCDEAFEWDQLQRLSKQEMKGANTKLMRKFAAASLAASLAAEMSEAAAAATASSASAATSAETSSAAQVAAPSEPAVAMTSAGGTGAQEVFANSSAEQGSEDVDAEVSGGCGEVGGIENPDEQPGSARPDAS